MEKIKVTVDWDKNYGAALEVGDGVVFATDMDLEGLKKEFASALDFHLESMSRDGDEIPVLFAGAFELEFELSPRALMHHADTLVSRAALAKASGIGVRQLGHYATGVSDPRPAQVARMKQGLREIVAQLSSLAL